MTATFHFDAGPFSVDVQLGDAGVQFKRGERHQSVAWERVTGATLLLPEKDDLISEATEQRLAQFLDEPAIRQIQELAGKVGEIVIAYRDEKDSLREIQIPAPLSDPAFLQEFEERLGPRWKGESRNRDEAAKRLHTNPGLLKTLLVLVLLLAVPVIVAAIVLFGLLGPLLNLLSLQKMLLDVQDGNYVGLSYRVITYVALFAIGYLLQRVIRDRLASRRSPFARRYGPRR